MVFKGFVSLVFSLFLFGCSNQLTSSLLTDYKGCFGTNCSSSASGTVGEISLDPDEKTMSVPAEVSDLVEVSGSCQDLNIRNNRILVQVFDSDNISGVPYIDNSRDVYCDDAVNTAEFRSVVSGGVTTKQQCFFVSNGVGLVDNTGLYPQCYNGRFAFKVRVGRVVRKDPFIADTSESNPIVPYTLRMKIRTIENVSNDSNWIVLPIARYISSPKVEATAPTNTMRVELKIKPAKQRDIRYTIGYSWSGPSYVLSAPGSPAAFTNSSSGTVVIGGTPYTVSSGIVSGVIDRRPDFPIKSDGTSIDNFYIKSPDGNQFNGPFAGISGLMPGLTYNYEVSAADFQYNYTVYPGPGLIERGTSTTVTVKIPPPLFSSYTVNPGGKNTCQFTLGGVNTNGYRLEWRYATSPNWMQTDPNSGNLVTSPFCNSGSLSTCDIVFTDGGYSAGNTYYFAARQYIDGNNNNQWDPGEIVGEWSLPLKDQPEAYSCTFVL